MILFLMLHLFHQGTVGCTRYANRYEVLTIKSVLSLNIKLSFIYVTENFEHSNNLPAKGYPKVTFLTFSLPPFLGTIESIYVRLKHH